jgi:hypothetical protein
MKRVTELEYDLIKALKASVKSQTETARLAGRSQPTITAVWRSKSYDEYMLHSKKPVETVAAPAPLDDMQRFLLSIADAQMEILKSMRAMAENMQFLSDNLPVQERSKLRLFGR